MSYEYLLSGSDIRGEAVDAGAQEARLTEDIARRVGWAFAESLADGGSVRPGALTVAVGRDSRISGPLLATAVLEGIAAFGAETVDCGLCTTPAMFLTALEEGIGCDGSVMVTASHHPWTKNGLKFFTGRGGLSGTEVRRLLLRAEEISYVSAAGRAPRRMSFLPRYAEILTTLLRGLLDTDAARPLEGLRICVDAGNGAGGFYAETLAALGADITGSLYLEPDGFFPNHVPNPEDATAMESLCAAVKRNGADIGVVFDADCDRAAMVGEGGIPINRNRLIALASVLTLRRHPGGTVVTDSTTSAGLARFIRSLGGTHHRFKRGYRNVIDEAVRLNAEGINCPLAIETSGHCAMRDNYFLDDGMYLATVLIAEALRLKSGGKRIADLIVKLEEPAEEKELRLRITARDFAHAGKAALERLAGAAGRWTNCRRAPDDREGVRLLFGPEGRETAWLMMRLSVHDPVLPVNFESETTGLLPALQDRLRDALDGCEGLDLRPLQSQ